VIHHCSIVVTLHGSDIFQAAQGRLGAMLTRRVLQGCDRIIAVSQALAEAVGQIGISPDPITVIPDGVDLSQFSPAQNNREPLLLYIGSLIKRKGVEYLIEALALIAQKQPSLRLLIVGDGPERPTLERLVSNRCLTERVTFAGQQPPNEVRLWLQQAKLFVLPSVEEGLGVVLLEALACGVPIVASRVGGIPEAVTLDVGLLVPPADPTLLGEAIIQLLSDEQRWQTLSQNARKRAEEFYDWRQIAAKLINIYQDLSCN
jgi:glycosyltransferase involved in cell wall biosynthesis